MSGGVSAHLTAHLGEVLRSDTEPVGVEGHVAMLAKIAPVEHGLEPFHKVCLGQGDVRLAVLFDVEIVEVDYHALDGVDHGVAVEVVFVDFEAAADIVEIESADTLLFFVEMHDGVVEQRQSAPHAVVAHRCGEFDEAFGHIDYLHLEIGFGLDVAESVAPTGYDHAVASLEKHWLVVVVQKAAALRAPRVEQIAFQERVVGSSDVVGDDDIF